MLLIRFYATPSVPEDRYGWKDYLVHALVLAGVLYPIVGGMRGGFGVTVRPIALNDAKLYCEEPLQTALVLNTAFSMYKTIEAKPFPQPAWFSSEEAARAVFDPVHVPAPGTEFKARNVVVLVLESFSAAYSEFLTQWQGQPHEGYMPFLDSLMQESLVFKYSFAHDRISISALPAVMTSIPMVVEPYFLTPYANDRLRGLAMELVENKGYASAFFHGAQRQSLGLAGFAESIVSGTARSFSISGRGLTPSRNLSSPRSSPFPPTIPSMFRRRRPVRCPRDGFPCTGASPTPTAPSAPSSRHAGRNPGMRTPCSSSPATIRTRTTFPPTMRRSGAT